LALELSTNTGSEAELCADDDVAIRDNTMRLNAENKRVMMSTQVVNSVNGLLVRG